MQCVPAAAAASQRHAATFNPQLWSYIMVNTKLFMADGGKIRGLSAAANGVGTLGAVPKEGDFIVMGAPANSPAFKVERVTFLFNEDAVRLIVSPIGI